MDKKRRYYAPGFNHEAVQEIALTGVRTLVELLQNMENGWLRLQEN